MLLSHAHAYNKTLHVFIKYRPKLEIKITLKINYCFSLVDYLDITVYIDY